MYQHGKERESVTLCVKKAQCNMAYRSSSSSAQFLPASVTRARIANVTTDLVTTPLDAQPEHPSEAAVQLTGFFDGKQLVTLKEGLSRGKTPVIRSEDFAREHHGHLNDIAFTYTDVYQNSQKRKRESEKLSNNKRRRVQYGEGGGGDGDGRKLKVMFSANGLGQEIERNHPNLDEKTKLDLLQTGISIAGVNLTESVSSLSPNGVWGDQDMTLLVAGHRYLTSYTTFHVGDLVEAVVPDRATLQMLPPNKNKATPTAVKLFLRPKRSKVLGEQLKHNMERMIIQPPEEFLPELLPWHTVAQASMDHAFMAFAAFFTELVKADILKVSFGDRGIQQSEGVQRMASSSDDTFIAQLAYMFGMTHPTVAVDSNLYKWTESNAALVTGLKRQMMGRLWKSPRVPGNLAYGFDATEQKPNKYIGAEGVIDKSEPVGALMDLQLSSVSRYVESVTEAIYMDNKNVVGHATTPIDKQHTTGDRSFGVLLH